MRQFFGLGGGEGGKKKGKGKGREEELEAECVKKFVGMNKENALKTKPRDYEADHRDIALLRLRNFTIGRKLKDEEIVGEGGLERVVELIGCLVPFVSLPLSFLQLRLWPMASSQERISVLFPPTRS